MAVRTFVNRFGVRIFYTANQFNTIENFKTMFTHLPGYEKFQKSIYALDKKIQTGIVKWLKKSEAECEAFSSIRTYQDVQKDKNLAWLKANRRETVKFW